MSIGLELGIFKSAFLRNFIPALTHPNLEAIVRDGHALFADDETPLDERVITVDCLLSDQTGCTYSVEVPTFADPRLAALLEARREAELTQCAHRGRPLQHPDVQITLLFSLPLPDLPPTQIVVGTPSPLSSVGRAATTLETLVSAAKALLAQGKRLLDAQALVVASGCSIVTVRKYWTTIAARLNLKVIFQRRTLAMPRGGRHVYQHPVLFARGRAVAIVDENQGEDTADYTSTAVGSDSSKMDQAHNKDSLTLLIPHRPPSQRGFHRGFCRQVRMVSQSAEDRACAATCTRASAKPP